MSGINKDFSIGKYDAGTFDLAGKATLKKEATVNTQNEAIKLAKQTTGSDLIVQRKDQKTGNGVYDVFTLNTGDKNQKLNTLKDVNNLKFFDEPLNVIESKTGDKGNIKGLVVTESGELSKPIYKNQFKETSFEKIRSTVNTIRESVGIEKNAPWFWLVDTVMGGDSPADNLPAIDRKELNNMKEHLKKGDIIMSGNDGSFIHGIMYVGKDSQLQEQLEKKWNLPKGALKDEGIIIHSLLTDSEKDVEINGKKEHIGASGSGVNADTIERYTARHPRDVMVAATIKDTSDKDRESAVNSMKSFIGKDYDRYFDKNDDKEMYCTEAVMKAWESSSKPPEFKTQSNPLVSYPKFVLDKLPEKVAKKLQDGGFLNNEMIMTDGIATSSSTEVVWASKNADKSEFFKKHERWANAVEGNAPKGYTEMVLRDVPNESKGSRALLDKIKIMSERTRTELK